MASPEPIRNILLAAVRTFCGARSRLRGVRRLAMIGSLTTSKENPKDADVLVWVEDGTDLKPLAKVARQLKGTAQQQNHGADIFIVHPSGRYLGRICHHRDCQPGIRICAAANCGRRPHLRDDFGRLVLKAAVIQSPPVDLYPKVMMRSHVPADVEAMVRGMESGDLPAD